MYQNIKRCNCGGLSFPQYIYEYQCFATNLEEAPIEIYHLYKDRAESENWIEAVKNQIGAGATIVNHFWVNDDGFVKRGKYVILERSEESL